MGMVHDLQCAKPCSLEQAVTLLKRVPLMKRLLLSAVR